VETLYMVSWFCASCDEIHTLAVWASNPDVALSKIEEICNRLSVVVEVPTEVSDTIRHLRKMEVHRANEEKLGW